MIDLLSSLPPLSGTPLACVAIGTGTSALPGGGDTLTGAAPSAPIGSFEQTLGQFLDVRDASLDRSLPTPTPRNGQETAADGKDLPAAHDGDDARPESNEATAWLPAFPTPLPATVAPPLSSPPAPADDVRATAPVAPAAPEPLPIAPDTPSRGTAPTPPADARHIARVPPGADTAPPTATAPAPSQSAPSRPSPPTLEALAGAAIVKGTAPAQADRAAQPGPTADPRPESAIAVSTTPQPAGQLFAAAIATAGSWPDRVARTPAHDLADGIVPVGAVPVALHDRAIVHATGDAQGTALDLTRDSGLQRMIDRIETLRDAVGDATGDGAGDGTGASDTRIRLVPDALGSVDIAVRREGDRVHVRFTAEQEATRALIAEAQPRLTELAAARGVRIGETSVGTGGGQTAGGDNAAPQPRPAPRLARAPRTAATDTASTTDQRLA